MNQPLIDIGSNLTHDQFRRDRDAVIKRAVDAGVVAQVVTGASEEGSRQALDLARTRDDLYATAGVHPHSASECNDDTLTLLRQLAADPNVVAIGECGLDFNRNFSTPADQERAFAAQLDLAVALKKPVFLHERDAHARFVEILEPRLAKLPGAVVHCFTGKGEELDRYVSLGCTIGITGWICDDRRGTHLKEIVDRIPADRIMVETDSPYLLPRDLRPKPKSRRNEPSNLPHVARTVAECRGESFETLAKQTTENAKRFFGLTGVSD